MANPTVGQPGAGKKPARPVLVLILVGILVVAATAFIGLTRMFDNNPDAPTSLPSSASSPSEPAGSPGATARRPTEADLAALVTELGSGSAERIAPFLGADPDEVDPAFAAGVVDLGITLPDLSDVKDLGGGLFEIRARDKADNGWAIGLQYRSDQLVIVYAEPI